MTSAVSTHQWVASVQGLDPEVALLAEGLFSRHNVDADFLNFLASEGGLHILAAWRTAHSVKTMPAGATSRVSKSADETIREVTAHEAAALPAQTTKAGAPHETSALPASKRMGRQRISTAERRNEGHYFGCAQPTLARAQDPNDCHSASTSKAPPDAKAMHPQPSAFQEVSQSTPCCVDMASTKTSNSVGLAAATTENVEAPFSGTLKSFSNERRYGFIRCDSFQQDVFLRFSELPDDRHLEPGRTVLFQVIYDARGRPQAQNVVWSQLPNLGAEGSVGRFRGKLKSVGDDYGFIDCPEAFRLYHRDVYFTRAQLPAGSWQLAQDVTFDVILNAREQPQAKHMAWAAESDSDTEANDPGSLPRSGKRW